MAYAQKTWKAASGEPMHAESGYWRPKPDGSIEVVIAQSTGLAEVLVGNSNHAFCVQFWSNAQSFCLFWLLQLYYLRIWHSIIIT
jgi:hypothetical protein